jgi:hypothetical protein
VALSREERVALLREAGLAPQPGGYELDALERVMASRGWIWTTSPTTTYHGRPGRWRATVVEPPRSSGGRVGFLLGSQRTRATEAEALEKALCMALARYRPAGRPAA